MLLKVSTSVARPLNLHRRTLNLKSTTTCKMPSSKGEPTDPELREKIKEEVKAEEKGKTESFLSPDQACG